MGGLSICDKDNGRERLEVSGFIVKELDLEMMCTTIHQNSPLKMYRECVKQFCHVMMSIIAMLSWQELDLEIRTNLHHNIPKKMHQMSEEMSHVCTILSDRCDAVRCPGLIWANYWHTEYTNNANKFILNTPRHCCNYPPLHFKCYLCWEKLEVHPSMLLRLRKNFLIKKLWALYAETFRWCSRPNFLFDVS